MAELCSLEEQRHSAALRVITDLTQAMRERQRKHMLNFIVELTKTVKSQLLLMDIFIYPTEITGNPQYSYILHKLLGPEAIGLLM